jgi:hypothetical protein
LSSARTAVFRQPPAGVIALALYVAYAILLTWPLVLEPDRRIFGVTGDLTGGIAILRELADDYLNPFVPGRIEDFGAPDGRPVDWVINLLSAPGVAFRYLLAPPVGAVAAMNIYAVLGLVGSALAMFLFARKLTGSAGVGIVIGWAFGFAPQMVAQAREHPDFVHGWVLVLLAWRVLVFIEGPTRRNGLLASASCLLAFAWTPYYVLLAGVLYATVLVLGAARTAIGRRWRALGAYGWCMIGPVSFLAFAAAITFIKGESPAPARTLPELYMYSARSFEYMLPDAWNPLLGDLTAPYLDARRHGSYKGEQSLYLGLSLLALAAVSVVLALRQVLERSRSGVRARGSTSVVAVFAVVALAGVLFSAPPTAGALGFEVRMPSWYVYEVTTAWRVFARFGLVVMLAVCVLAAIGLAKVLTVRNATARAALLTLVGVVIVADLISVPPERTMRLDAPAVYVRLKSMAPGNAAEYPMAIRPFPGDYNELLFQDAHAKPLVNGYLDGSAGEARALTIAKLPPRAAAQGLALLGVRYVVVRKASPLLGPGLLPPDMSSRWFRILAEDSYAQVFRVDAAPGGSLVALTKGFDVDEGGFRWMTSAEGEIEVRAACDRCAGTLVFDAWSLGPEQEMVVQASQARVLERATLTPEKTRFRLPLRFRNRIVLRLSATPGPVPVRSVIPANPDPRSISIGLSNPPQFVPNSPSR